MLDLIEAPTRRSNRPVTEFACNLTNRFLMGTLEPGKQALNNTSVSCTESKSAVNLFVDLFDHTILDILLALPTEEPIHVRISVGDYFDGYGHPTKTTIERLNGLLDCIGSHGIIPEGVRIFKDRSTDTFYLGKGDKRIPVGKKYARNVFLKPNCDEFIIEYSDIDLNSK